jgi:hypothetical protein
MSSPPRGSYQLVLNVTLINLKVKKISHGVVWDGKMVHDTPFVYMFNTMEDQINLMKSNFVFKSLFPDSVFPTLQIPIVNKLEHYDGNQTHTFKIINGTWHVVLCSVFYLPIRIPLIFFLRVV